MIRRGIVVAVDEKTAKVRVRFPDLDDMISDWFPVVVQKSKDDKFYWLPDIGEMVVVAFDEDGDFTTGYVLGAIYNSKNTVPVANKDKYMIRFQDGTIIEYDRKARKLTAVVNGDIEITANTTTVTTITTHNGNVTINGNLVVNGNITASQEIYDLRGSRGSLSQLRDTYNSHTHPGDSGGITGTPNQTV